MRLKVDQLPTYSAALRNN